QEVARVLAALTDAVATEGVPGAGLLDDTLLGRDVDQLSLLGDAGAVQDVELRLAERRRHLVLHHLHLGAAADHLVAVLEGAEAADVEPHGGVELERVAARRGLGVAEHDADLHADLVDEGADAAALLALGDELERERGLTRRLRSVDLDHPPARDPADAERDIEAERARRQAGDVLRQRLLAELHDGALAELLLDLADGEVDRPLPIHVDAHVTPSPARSTWTPGPNFPETDHSTLALGRSPAARATYFQLPTPRRGCRDTGVYTAPVGLSRLSSRTTSPAVQDPHAEAPPTSTAAPSPRPARGARTRPKARSPREGPPTGGQPSGARARPTPA